MITVVSHDAGGAEILSSYIKKQKLEVLYVLEGPARKIFERKLGSIKFSTLEDAIPQSTSILCGTSWQSDIEFNAIKLAHTLCIHSIAFLDHWVNYRERFVRKNETYLPNEIWVGDAIAEKMAQDIFIDIPITLVENPYEKEILEDLNTVKKSRIYSPNSISILYVCEPLSEHALKQYGNAHHWGYVEEEALRYFLLNLSVLKKSVERILIRPHPSEREGKYDWLFKEFNLPIEIGGARTLLEEIVDSDIVVGCESMAMVVALIAGKKVISCIPPGGRACVLPHTEIISLHNLLKN